MNLTDAELRWMLERATQKVFARKCPCGDPACYQYTLTSQGSVGFDEVDAALYAAAPDLATEVLRLRAARAELSLALMELCDAHWGEEDQLFTRRIVRNAEALLERIAATAEASK